MKFNYVGTCLLLSIVIDCLSITRGQLEEIVGTQEKQILDTILNDRYYDKNFRPGRSNNTGPTLILVSFDIHRIKQLDDLNMELEMSFTIVQEWVDERLRFSHLNGNIQHIHSPYLAQQKIWIPDTYFVNQVHVDHQSSIGPNIHIRISSDGTVVHSNRITGIFYCPLHLKEFPHDSQTCPLKVTSYGYIKEDIDFEWVELSPISISEEASYLPKFDFVGFLTKNCSSDEKSCIEVDVSFKRKISHYLIHIYIPCAMMVIIAFLSLWLDPIRMATPRALICVAILVLAVVQISTLNATLAPVSYTKGIDIWTGVILTFLFFAVAEFVLVGCICRLRTERRKNAAAVKDASEDNLELPTVLKQFNNPGSEDIELQTNLAHYRCALNIDRVARFVFPLLFIVFLVIYWLIYVNRLI